MKYKAIDFPKIVKDKCVVIANEIHNILYKYGFTEDGKSVGSDFEAIEEIISVFEKHGYSGGNIHDF